MLFGLDLAKSEIVKRRQVVVVEGYTDVMAMHLAGVPTAVASCGTAFGAEHIGVIRRLIGDDSFDLGEVIYTFDGDAAGQAAALKAFDGEQAFATQTYVTIAPDGQDPCELRQTQGDAAVRDLVARREPIYEFAIRSVLREFDLDSAEGRVAALQRTVPLVARIKREELRDEYARRLAGWASWDDIAMVVRRVRETAGAPVEPRGRRGRSPAPPKDDPRLHVQREALKAALQVPGDRRSELRRAARAGVHPPRAGRRCTGPCRRRAGSAPGCPASRGWRPSRPSARPRPGPLVSELAVEPMELPRRTHSRSESDEARYVASVVAGVRLALVEAQVAELKSRLQRTNPVEEPDAYHQLFGDLVPLEQYKIALREQPTMAARAIAGGCRPAAAPTRACSDGRSVLEPEEHVVAVARGRRAAGRSSPRPGGCGCPTAQRAALAPDQQGDLGGRRARRHPGPRGRDGRGRRPHRRRARRAGSGWPRRAGCPRPCTGGSPARSRRRHHRDLPGGGAWFVQRTRGGPRRRGPAGARRTLAPTPTSWRQVARDVAQRLPPDVNSTSVLLAREHHLGPRAVPRLRRPPLPARSTT